MSQKKKKTNGERKCVDTHAMKLFDLKKEVNPVPEHGCPWLEWGCHAKKNKPFTEWQILSETRVVEVPRGQGRDREYSGRWQDYNGGRVGGDYLTPKEVQFFKKSGSRCWL